MMIQINKKQTGRRKILKPVGAKKISQLRLGRLVCSEVQGYIIPPFQTRALQMVILRDFDDEMEMACATVASASVFLKMGSYYLEYLDREPPRNRYLTARHFTEDVIKSNEDYHNLLRMNVEAFDRLVYILKGTGRLHDTVHLQVDEQIAIFLHGIAHNAKNRALKCYFRRSGETIFRYFNDVMYAIISMQDYFIKPPEEGIPPEIAENPRFMPYFKNCVGAVDGTHIPAKVSSDIVARFWGRKSWPSQNVMAACSFDLKFTYVLPGWEGSGSDSRILECALTRTNYKITCSSGKYYLVDAGYPLLRQFITPFRKTRYHLNEYRGRVPSNAKELFNHRHSSLRNAIERAFGVLKKRFSILREEPFHSWETQVDVVIACCIIRNHIRGVMPCDSLLDEVDRELERQDTSRNNVNDETFSRNAEGRAGKLLRASIMNDMWSDFH